MIPSAFFSTEEQYLQVVSAEPSESSAGSSTKNERLPALENVLFSKVSPLYYNARVHLSFSISDQFRKNIALIRGLIEFNRPKHFSFEYHFTHKSFETDIEAIQLSELESFLDKVSNLLEREINFKDSLRAVLEFENRYKRAKTEVYARLFNGGTIEP